MPNRRILTAALIAAAALPVPAAVAMPPDLHGVHHRATTADVEHYAPASTEAPAHGFPWLETAGLVGLVTAAGVGARAAHRRSAPA